jgi:hypothetical protein
MKEDEGIKEHEGGRRKMKEDECKFWNTFFTILSLMQYVYLQ